jgi:membrane protein YqaA with SNARE-associated domain
MKHLIRREDHDPRAPRALFPHLAHTTTLTSALKEALVLESGTSVALPKPHCADKLRHRRAWIYQMLRPLYERTLAAAGHRRAIWWLALVSFIESSIFPIPPDVILIPMVLENRDRWLRLALVCTAASVAGGMVGYAIGLFLFESIGQTLLNFYGYDDKFTAFGEMYNEWGAWIVFGAGLTPFPYKVTTIASGVTHLDLMVFSIASVLSRGLRFLIVAALLWKFGPAIRGFLERHLGPLTLLFFVLLIGGFIALKYLL